MNTCKTWVNNFFCVSLLIGLIAGFCYLTLYAVVKTEEISSFRRGVECSVRWNPNRCGPNRSPAVIAND